MHLTQNTDGNVKANYFAAVKTSAGNLCNSENLST